MNRTDRWLVPGILTAIAVIQISLASFAGLTPWKGGGFGMFASIDAASMRVVSCEGVTLDGETILIDALQVVDVDRESNMRAIPTEQGLWKVGHELLMLDFVPGSVQDEAAIERLQHENPDLRMPAQITEDLYRPFRSSDPDDWEPVELKSVRLQWWKIVYDSEETIIRTVPLGEAVELRRPGM